MKKLKLEELEVASLVTSIESHDETKGGTSPAVATSGPCALSVVGTVASALIISAVIIIGTNGSY